MGSRYRDSLSIGVGVLLLAVLLDGVTYAGLNAWWIRVSADSLASVYQRPLPAPATSTQPDASTDPYQQRLWRVRTWLDLGPAARRPDPADRWLERVAADLPAAPSGAAVLLAMLREVDGAATNSERAASRRQRLRDLLVGEPAWYAWVFPCRPPPASLNGEAVVARLVDAQWSRLLRATESDPQAVRSLVVAAAERLCQAGQPARRGLLRFGGWIQWVTLLVAWFALVLIAQRASMVSRSRGQLHSGGGEAMRASGGPLAAVLDAVDEPESVEHARARIERLKGALKDRAYETLGFLLGAMPSLGFIGTVLGMGDALGAAEGLFRAESESSRQAAVAAVTYDLGLAFDTTLIALLASLVVGIAAWRLWQQEMALLEAAESWVRQRSATVTATASPDQAPPGELSDSGQRGKPSEPGA